MLIILLNTSGTQLNVHGRVEGLLRAPQAATIRPIYTVSDHEAQLIRSRC